MNATAKIAGAALRDVTVRDYKRNAERAGLPVDMAALERQAVADCNLYDAVMRDASPSAPPKPDPEKEAEKADALTRAMREEAGASPVGELVPDPSPEILSAVPSPNDAWALALGRKAVILRGAHPLNSAPPGASPADVMKAILSTCEMPKLAWEFYRLHAHWHLYRSGHGRRRIDGFGKVEANVFAGLRKRDAARKYQRLVEDICDRSTGKLGPWRTPK